MSAANIHQLYLDINFPSFDRRGGGLDLFAAYSEPHLAFKVDAWSGDNNPNLPHLETFNVLYARGHYFTEPAPL